MAAGWGGGGGGEIFFCYKNLFSSSSLHNYLVRAVPPQSKPFISRFHHVADYVNVRVNQRYLYRVFVDRRRIAEYARHVALFLNERHLASDSRASACCYGNYELVSGAVLSHFEFVLIFTSNIYRIQIFAGKY